MIATTIMISIKVKPLAERDVSVFFCSHIAMCIGFIVSPAGGFVLVWRRFFLTDRFSQPDMGNIPKKALAPATQWAASARHAEHTAAATAHFSAKPSIGRAKR